MIDPFVLDASIAISWCFPDDPTENTAYSREILDLLETTDAIVPEVWPFEIANGLYVSVCRRKRMNEDQISKYVDLITGLPIRVDRRSWRETLTLESLARKHNLAVYDVAYLELAKRLGLSLATTDESLIKAAQVEGVRLTRGIP